MRITEAAGRLGTSPRMLRYRDRLGLLPHVRAGRGHGVPAAAGGRPRQAQALSGAAAPGGAGPRHRTFTEDDLAAVSLALRIEQRYDINPAALAFGLRVLAEPGVRAEVAELARRLGRTAPPPARALEFEKERALRLLGLPGARAAADRRPARAATPRRPSPAGPAAAGGPAPTAAVTAAAGGRGPASAARGDPRARQGR